MLPELGPKGKHLQLVACCADGSPGSHLFNRCYLLILLVGETLKLKCMENTHNGHRDKQADTFPVTYDRKYPGVVVVWLLLLLYSCVVLLALVS